MRFGAFSKGLYYIIKYACKECKETLLICRLSWWILLWNLRSNIELNADIKIS